MDAKAFSLIAAIFGLVGSVILAYSLNRVLSEVGLAVEALANSIESVAGNGDCVIYRGLDKRFKKANRISNSWVRAGIYCLLFSTGLAAWGLYIN